MPDGAVRDALRTIDAAGGSETGAEATVEQWVALCFLAGREVELDPDELNAAVRRAELLLAAGGNPYRDPELYGRATSALARDLDSPVARGQLHAGLERLEDDAKGLPGASEGIRLLVGDGDLAWQCFALALLADQLAH